MHPVTATDFTPGERVTITRGAMKGVSGVVQRIGKGFRLVVNVDMLGRGVAVELDVEMLAKQRKAAA